MFDNGALAEQRLSYTNLVSRLITAKLLLRHPRRPRSFQVCCDATAMCGIDSTGGKTPCALKLCYSYYGWCGTEDVLCHDPEPQYGKTPCQTGYGACAKISAPSCGESSGIASGRRVGYYQGWNSRERVCDKVLPGQINTKGLTHLFFAFAFFDPPHSR